MDGEENTLATARGAAAAALAGNLADPAARASRIAQAGAMFGPVSILVYNAADNSRTPPSAMTLAERSYLLEPNLQAAIDLVQAALPAMAARGFGRMLNILSETIHPPDIPYPSPAVHVHVHGTAVYGASKRALVRYNQGLAAELHGGCITANCLEPCRIAWRDGGDQVARQAMAHSPDWVEPLEVLAVAAFHLASSPIRGFCCTSRELLFPAQRPFMARDGHSLIGDAFTLLG